MYQSDAILIQASLEGDAAAWNELVSRYSRLVYSVALQFGRSTSHAEEIFQNVFTLLFCHLGDLNQQELSDWLICVTYRECQPLQRSILVNPRTFASQLDRAILTSEDIKHMYQRFKISLALEQLGPPCRDLLKAFLNSHTANDDEVITPLNLPAHSPGPMRARCFMELEDRLRSMGLWHSK